MASALDDSGAWAAALSDRSGDSSLLTEVAGGAAAGFRPQSAAAVPPAAAASGAPSPIAAASEGSSSPVLAGIEGAAAEDEPMRMSVFQPAATPARSPQPHHAGPGVDSPVARIAVPSAEVASRLRQPHRAPDGGPADAAAALTRAAALSASLSRSGRPIVSSVALARAEGAAAKQARLQAQAARQAALADAVGAHSMARSRDVGAVAGPVQPRPAPAPAATTSASASMPFATPSTARTLSAFEAELDALMADTPEAPAHRTARRPQQPVALLDASAIGGAGSGAAPVPSAALSPLEAEAAATSAMAGWRDGGAAGAAAHSLWTPAASPAAPPRDHGIVQHAEAAQDATHLSSWLAGRADAGAASDLWLHASAVGAVQPHGIAAALQSAGTGAASLLAAASTGDMNVTVGAIRGSDDGEGAALHRAGSGGVGDGRHAGVDRGNGGGGQSAATHAMAAGSAADSSHNGPAYAASTSAGASPETVSFALSPDSAVSRSMNGSAAHLPRTREAPLLGSELGIMLGHRSAPRELPAAAPVAAHASAGSNARIGWVSPVPSHPGLEATDAAGTPVSLLPFTTPSTRQAVLGLAMRDAELATAGAGSAMLVGEEAQQLLRRSVLMAPDAMARLFGGDATMTPAAHASAASATSTGSTTMWLGGSLLVLQPDDLAAVVEEAADGDGIDHGADEPGASYSSTAAAAGTSAAAGSATVGPPRTQSNGAAALAAEPPTTAVPATVPADSAAEADAEALLALLPDVAEGDSLDSGIWQQAAAHSDTHDATPAGAPSSSTPGTSLSSAVRHAPASTAAGPHSSVPPAAPPAPLVVEAASLDSLVFRVLQRADAARHRPSPAGVEGDGAPALTEASSIDSLDRTVAASLAAAAPRGPAAAPIHTPPPATATALMARHRDPSLPRSALKPPSTGPYSEPRSEPSHRTSRATSPSRGQPQQPSDATENGGSAATPAAAAARATPGASPDASAATIAGDSALSTAPTHWSWRSGDAAGGGAGVAAGSGDSFAGGTSSGGWGVATALGRSDVSRIATPADASRITGLEGTVSGNSGSGTAPATGLRQPQARSSHSGSRHVAHILGSMLSPDAAPSRLSATALNHPPIITPPDAGSEAASPITSTHAPPAALAAAAGPTLASHDDSDEFISGEARDALLQAPLGESSTGMTGTHTQAQRAALAAQFRAVFEAGVAAGVQADEARLAAAAGAAGMGDGDGTASHGPGGASLAGFDSGVQPLAASALGGGYTPFFAARSAPITSLSAAQVREAAQLGASTASIPSFMRSLAASPAPLPLPQPRDDAIAEPASPTGPLVAPTLLALPVLTVAATDASPAAAAVVAALADDIPRIRQHAATLHHPDDHEVAPQASGIGDMDEHDGQPAVGDAGPAPRRSLATPQKPPPPRHPAVGPGRTLVMGGGAGGSTAGSAPASSSAISAAATTTVPAARLSLPASTSAPAALSDPVVLQIQPATMAAAMAMTWSATQPTVVRVRNVHAAAAEGGAICEIVGAGASSAAMLDVPLRNSGHQAVAVFVALEKVQCELRDATGAGGDSRGAVTSGDDAATAALATLPLQSIGDATAQRHDVIKTARPGTALYHDEEGSTTTAVSVSPSTLPFLAPGQVGGITITAHLPVLLRHDGVREALAALLRGIGGASPHPAHISLAVTATVTLVAAPLSPGGSGGTLPSARTLRSLPPVFALPIRIVAQLRLEDAAASAPATATLPLPLAGSTAPPPQQLQDLAPHAMQLLSVLLLQRHLAEHQGTATALVPAPAPARALAPAAADSRTGDARHRSSRLELLRAEELTPIISRRREDAPPAPAPAAAEAGAAAQAVQAAQVAGDAPAPSSGATTPTRPLRRSATSTPTRSPPPRRVTSLSDLLHAASPPASRTASPTPLVARLRSPSRTNLTGSSGGGGGDTTMLSSGLQRPLLAASSLSHMLVQFVLPELPVPADSDSDASARSGDSGGDVTAVAMEEPDATTIVELAATQATAVTLAQSMVTAPASPSVADRVAQAAAAPPTSDADVTAVSDVSSLPSLDATIPTHSALHEPATPVDAAAASTSLASPIPLAASALTTTEPAATVAAMASYSADAVSVGSAPSHDASLSAPAPDTSSTHHDASNVTADGGTMAAPPDRAVSPVAEPAAAAPQHATETAASHPMEGPAEPRAVSPSAWLDVSAASHAVEAAAAAASTASGSGDSDGLVATAPAVSGLASSSVEIPPAGADDPPIQAAEPAPGPAAAAPVPDRSRSTRLPLPMSPATDAVVRRVRKPQLPAMAAASAAIVPSRIPPPSPLAFEAASPHLPAAAATGAVATPTSTVQAHEAVASRGRRSGGRSHVAQPDSAVGATGALSLSALATPKSPSLTLAAGARTTPSATASASAVTSSRAARGSRTAPRTPLAATRNAAFFASGASVGAGLPPAAVSASPSAWPTHEVRLPRQPATPPREARLLVASQSTPSRGATVAARLGVAPPALAPTSPPRPSPPPSLAASRRVSPARPLHGPLPPAAGTAAAITPAASVDSGDAAAAMDARMMSPANAPLAASAASVSAAILPAHRSRHALISPVQPPLWRAPASAAASVVAVASVVSGAGAPAWRAADAQAGEGPIVLDVQPRRRNSLDARSDAGDTAAAFADMELPGEAQHPPAATSPAPKPGSHRKAAAAASATSAGTAAGRGSAAGSRRKPSAQRIPMAVARQQWVDLLAEHGLQPDASPARMPMPADLGQSSAERSRRSLSPPHLPEPAADIGAADVAGGALAEASVTSTPPRRHHVHSALADAAAGLASPTTMVSALHRIRASAAAVLSAPLAAPHVDTTPLPATTAIATHSHEWATPSRASVASQAALFSPSDALLELLSPAEVAALRSAARKLLALHEGGGTTSMGGGGGTASLSRTPSRVAASTRMTPTRDAQPGSTTAATSPLVSAATVLATAVAAASAAATASSEAASRALPSATARARPTPGTNVRQQPLQLLAELAAAASSGQSSDRLPADIRSAGTGSGGGDGPQGRILSADATSHHDGTPASALPPGLFTPASRLAATPHALQPLFSPTVTAAEVLASLHAALAPARAAAAPKHAHDAAATAASAPAPRPAPRHAWYVHALTTTVHVPPLHVVAAAVAGRWGGTAAQSSAASPLQFAARDLRTAVAIVNRGPTLASVVALMADGSPLPLAAAVSREPLTRRRVEEVVRGGGAAASATGDTAVLDAAAVPLLCASHAPLEVPPETERKLGLQVALPDPAAGPLRLALSWSGDGDRGGATASWSWNATRRCLSCLVMLVDLAAVAEAAGLTSRGGGDDAGLADLWPIIASHRYPHLVAGATASNPSAAATVRVTLHEAVWASAGWRLAVGEGDAFAWLLPPPHAAPAALPRAAILASTLPTHQPAVRATPASRASKATAAATAAATATASTPARSTPPATRIASGSTMAAHSPTRPTAAAAMAAEDVMVTVPPHSLSTGTPGMHLPLRRIYFPGATPQGTAAAAGMVGGGVGRATGVAAVTTTIKVQVCNTSRVTMEARMKVTAHPLGATAAFAIRPAHAVVVLKPRSYCMLPITFQPPAGDDGTGRHTALLLVEASVASGEARGEELKTSATALLVGGA